MERRDDEVSLKRSGFYEATAERGATFVEYADYDFPSQYAADILDEYRACRERAIVIDLTPLRKVEVSGPGAEAVLQAAVTRDLRRLADGDVVYTSLCDDDGRLVDDGTVFRFAPERFRWVGYTDEDEGWLRDIAEKRGLEVDLENSTDRVHNLALQGPRSRDILAPLLLPAEGRRKVSDLTWFTFTEGTLGSQSGPHVLVSRTGYSGELGYEVWCRPEDGGAVFETIWSAGEPVGLAPLGLDALDIVRVEAGLIFKGYEYEGEEDPFEAGIGFTVPKSKSDDYVGKDALERRRADPRNAFVGLELEGGDVPAHGDVVSSDGRSVGVITSAIDSPYVGRPIAFARVSTEVASLGTALVVSLEGGGETGASVVRVPFYDPDKRRPRS